MLKCLKVILIVEYTPDLLFLLQNWLEPKGARILPAEDGIVALQFLKREPVDLIITDFRMPGMDGIQILNWCRENGRHMPVIFTTADPRRFEREEIALGDCCATLVMKPFNFEILEAALDAADSGTHNPFCMH